MADDDPYAAYRLPPEGGDRVVTPPASGGDDPYAAFRVPEGTVTKTKDAPAETPQSWAEYAREAAHGVWQGMKDQTRLAGNAATFGQWPRVVAGADALTSGKTYDEALDNQLNMASAAKSRLGPFAAGTAEATGGLTYRRASRRCALDRHLDAGARWWRPDRRRPSGRGAGRRQYLQQGCIRIRKERPYGRHLWWRRWCRGADRRHWCRRGLPRHCRSRLVWRRARQGGERCLCRRPRPGRRSVHRRRHDPRRRPLDARHRARCRYRHRRPRPH